MCIDEEGESKWEAFRLRNWGPSSFSVGFKMDDTPIDLEAGEKLPPVALGARGRGGSSIVLPFPSGACRGNAGDAATEAGADDRGSCCS